VRADPVRAALIVGNATYTSSPGIPACARSANMVSAALRTPGFVVTERQDASTGGINAGITEFSQHIAGDKNAGLVYVCGYASDFNDRIFLLPTTANITRPSDLLTQGVLAKTMLNTVSRDPGTVAVVVFDLVPKPDAPARLDLDALTALPVPDGVGIIAVSETAMTDKPTPLAAALVAALAGPTVRTDELLASVLAKLSGGAVGLVSSHMPARPGLLVGTPPPEPQAPKPQAPVAVSVAPPAVAPPPVAPPPAIALPDEATMTDEDRRKVQGALVRLGYYNFPVDGRFGPETRAAMRRYQHELGAEMTGRLTAEQATKLVATP
jgi:hypothetical protein